MLRPPAPVLCSVVPANAQDADSHGMSAFGDLNYPADFSHFTYVNAARPKVGAYSEIVATRGYNGSFLTFTSLNGYILKGEGALGMDYTFAPLMVRGATSPMRCMGWPRAVSESPTTG